jgi:hypothetical protein
MSPRIAWARLRRPAAGASKAPLLGGWRLPFVLGVTTVLVASPLLALEVTVTFQQGVDDYLGTLDVYIGADVDGTIDDVPDVDGNVLGASVAEQFLDGVYFAEQGNNNEPQLLLRFDDIIGVAPGQIPLGARITDASLMLTTGTSSGNARSGGPCGVAQLLVPFNTSTTWNSLGGNGATYGGGQNARPLGQGFRGGLEAGTRYSANVTRIVQDWASGAANEGFVVRAGTTDGWQLFATGEGDTSRRPKLTVTFDTDPGPPSATVVLQNGEGYSGTTMAWLQQSGVTTNGLDLPDGAYLDGPASGSPDDQALIKFNNIFASDGGPVADNAQITQASLVIDTYSASWSTAVGTNGNYSVHQMLVDWDLSTVYGDFGANGPDEAAGSIGPALDVTGAMIANARTYLDVTDAVKAWQGGAPNYGLNVQAFVTSDGWRIHWLASGSPPQLVVSYVVPEPGTLVLLAIGGLSLAVTVWRRRRGR